MQPGVPAEAGSAKAVTQRQASQRQQPSALFPSPAPAPMLSSVAGGVRRSERRAPMLRRCRWGPKDRKAGTNAPSVADETRRSEDRQGTAPSGRVLAGKCPCRSALRREPPCRSVLRRERPCGRVPAKAPRKVPRKAPRVCPGSYCFGFGCAGRWLSSSSAASSAR